MLSSLVECCLSFWYVLIISKTGKIQIIPKERSHMGHRFTDLTIISAIILLEQPLLFTYKWISHFDLMNHRGLFVNSLMSWHTIDYRQESQCDSRYNTRYNENNALRYDKVHDMLPTRTIPSQQFCNSPYIARQSQTSVQLKNTK